MNPLFSLKSWRFVLLAVLSLVGLLTTACKKDEPEIKDYSGIDRDIIEKYLAEKNITTAERQNSGLYFLPVTTIATAPKVAVNSSVAVIYTGYLLDAANTVFDASTTRSNPLFTFTAGVGQLIPGFDEGILKMHIGDKAELLIPSALAYGAKARGNIPANSVLRFEIEVINVPVFDDNLITAHLAGRNITTAQKQPSGLYFVPVLTNVSAPRPVIGSTVSVLYTARLFDAAGTVFDATSMRNNEPLVFELGRGRTITGFEQGIALMHKGDKAELFLPSALAYGVQGAPPTISPNTALRFEVELVDIR